MREILSSMDEKERRRYRVVRLDTLLTLPGIVVSANVDTGVCFMLNEADKSQTKYELGANGLRIV